MRLDGKVALVVGGGSGIGRAGAQAFVREAATVVVADLRPERAEAIAAGIGARATAATVDVASSEQVQRLGNETVERQAASTRCSTARPTSRSSTPRTAG